MIFQECLVKEKALLYRNLKRTLIKLPQRAGALKEFLADVLGPNDDITHFEYTKKHYKETGVAIVGIEVQKANELDGLIERMKARGFFSDYLNNKKTYDKF